VVLGRSPATRKDQRHRNDVRIGDRRRQRRVGAGAINDAGSDVGRRAHLPVRRRPESRPSGTGTTSGSVGEDDSVAVGAGANGTLRFPLTPPGPPRQFRRGQGRVADRTVTGGTRIANASESRRRSGDAPSSERRARGGASHRLRRGRSVVSQRRVSVGVGRDSRRAVLSVDREIDRTPRSVAGAIGRTKPASRSDRRRRRSSVRRRPG